MAISIDKEYTVGNRPARVICTDRAGQHPLVVLVTMPNQPYVKELCVSYEADGVRNNLGLPPLVEVKPRIRRNVWLNIYEGGVVSHISRAAADVAELQVPRARIACICVPVDCPYGEGLD